MQNQPNAYQTILERTCCRSFRSSTSISDDIILKLFKAAEAAPSAKNRQPYMIFAITNPDIKNEIAAAADEGRKRQFSHLTQEKLKSTGHGKTGSNDASIAEAPLVMLVLRNSDPEYHEAQTESKRLNIKEEESVANAAYSMQLAAQSLELASGWICSPLYIKKEIKQIFANHGIPWDDNWEPRVAIPIGYPKTPLTKTPRTKPIDTIAKIIK